mgnify:FL=1
MNKKLKFAINIVIILLVLGIVLYFSLKDNFNQILDCILKMNYLWFIIGILGLVGYRTLTGISTYLLAKLNNANMLLLRSIKISFIIQFFHGVTPFATGGQPMEVYYMHNEGNDITKSTNIVLQNFMVYQMALILLGLIAVTYNHKFRLFADNTLIKKLVVVGFAINTLVLIATFVISFSKKINKFICNQGLNLLAKLKIVKNKDNTKEKLEEYLNNFHKNATILKTHKLEVSKIVVINILALLSLYSIAFSVIYGLGYHDINFIDSIVTVAYIMVMGSFVPIPGGTGGIEYGYIFFFSYLIKGNILTASMLLWRLISYYLAIIIGGICLMTYRKKEKTWE